MSAPGHGSPSREPAPDDRLVMPGSRAEILNGRLIHAAPADEPHAKSHADLVGLLRLHVASGYSAACDMLTRTSKHNDFAPDASIYPESKEGLPRKLDELAFEVTSEQRLSIPTEKARELARRGVRRVFAILVKQKRVLEWDTSHDGWSPLSLDATIVDACLVRPVSVRALVDAALVDDEAARALLAKHNRVLEHALDEREAKAWREVVEMTAHRHALVLDQARTDRLRAMSVGELRALVAKLDRDGCWDD